ncbi:MAG: 16S rRNA (uracil(1498)-N(3))-methyltransferase [Woeseiaceae bacterium]
MNNPATPKTRLFSPETLVADSELWLTGEQARYVTRVLRLRSDDRLIIFDGTGGQYVAAIRELVDDRVLLQVGDRHLHDIESPLAIHLIQGISRGGRMDVVIQKSTELGVRRITPVTTQFSVVKLDAGRTTTRHEHWRKIARSACEQCGRNTLPEIDMPQKLDSWLAGGSGDAKTRIMLDPDGSESISSLPAPDGVVALLIGPEGGLSSDESTLCIDSGFMAISMGPRTLRTETAALAAIAVIQAYWGDMR